MTEPHANTQISNSASVSGFSGPDKPSYDDYARCVHCGLCLNNCPTYKLWGQEADSPRGRIRQMILVDQGRLPLGDAFVTHIDRCLDCRACETACPSGVEYGKLVEAARAQIEQNYQRPLFSRLARDFVFRRLLPYPNRIALVARLLRTYQRSGLQSLVRATGILHLLGLAGRERLLPPIDRTFFFSQLGRTYPASRPRRARVALFAGCIAQVSFSALHDATIRVLTANGCEVVVPAGQLCCGALAAHAGVRDTARSLAHVNLDVFLREDFDAVITNAAGCGSTLKEYDQLFAEGTEDHAKAHAFRKKMRDATEFLAELGLSGHGRLLLRIRRLLQRHRNGNLARYFGGENETRARNQRPRHRHGQSGMSVTNARGSANPFHRARSRARHRTSGPRAGEKYLSCILSQASPVVPALLSYFSPMRYRQPRAPMRAECTAPAGTSQRSPAA